MYASIYRATLRIRYVLRRRARSRCLSSAPWRAPVPRRCRTIRRHGRAFRAGNRYLLNTLYREGEAVYAVLDAIRDARIPAFLDASGEKYARVDDENPASPYLVLVPGRSRLLDVLVKDGWNHGWGFYFSASLEFENALWHWRTFVTLHNRNGQAVTFRFWDPRVLRAVVPAMTAGEAAGFFGLISRFVVEGDKPGLAVEFTSGAQWNPATGVGVGVMVSLNFA